MRPVKRMILLCALTINVAACAIDTPLLPEPASGTNAASATSVLKSSDQEQEAASRTTNEAAMDSGEVTLAPDQIRVDSTSLPVSWQVVVVPETSQEARYRPGVYGLPEHIEFRFSALGGEPWRQGDPVMYIIPLEAYQELWQENGSPTVTRIIEKLRERIASFSHQSPTITYPAHNPTLPDERTLGRANDIAVHLEPLPAPGASNTAAAKQEAFRFVGRWVQTPDPVTNEDLWYVFQGFSNDGSYLVSFWYPVSAPGLPDDLDEMPAEQIEQHFEDDPVARVKVVAGELNNLAPDRWQPDLAILDAVIASLEVVDVSIPEKD